MKKVISFCLIFLAFLVSSAPIYASEQTPDHLKYFGYYMISGDDNTEIAQLGFTNIITAPVTDLPTVPSNVKVILSDVWWQFFGHGQNGGLSDTYVSNWESYKELLRGHENKIYGFYFDEPVHNGYTVDAFRKASQMIRQDFNTKAVMVVEAAPPIKNGTIPKNYYEFVTDIGFDYYPTLQYTDNNQGWQAYQQVFDAFIGHINSYPDKKNIWIIPDGYGDNPSLWPDIWERYFQIAKDSDQAIGLLGFIYNLPSVLAGPGVVSLRNVLSPSDPAFMSSFRSRQQEIGSSILVNANKITCNAFKTVRINNCSSWDLYSSTPRHTQCITTTPNVTVYLNAQNASTFQLTSNSPWDTDCSQTPDSYFSAPQVYTSSLQVTLPFGSGDKKVCVKFTNNASSIKCGAAIWLDQVFADPPRNISPTPTVSLKPTEKTRKPGDIIGDTDVVDIFDFNQLISDFGKKGAPGFIPADIIQNGAVDIFDFNGLVASYGK